SLSDIRLPGDSEFVFHHPNGEPVIKDSYEYYLRRRCKSLGIKISHNHAFRVAFNARLIEAGVDGNERCLVLGHSMQTNERHYLFSDRIKVEDVRSSTNLQPLSKRNHIEHTSKSTKRGCLIFVAMSLF
ncbi:MAG: hypothetical protein K5779_04850, partial [Saccharofermentans sp.]|nr:hypothetical protein [Saccharofermentans sp.]